MKKLTVLTALFVIASTSYAAQLMPGAHVYTLKANISNGFPSFSGTIFNGNPSKPLTGTNQITVPNSFPSTIGSSAEYTVTPAFVKGGSEQWTKPIKYVDSDGNGCYLQFAWFQDKDTGNIIPDIALKGLTLKSYCDQTYLGRGTAIMIQ